MAATRKVTKPRVPRTHAGGKWTKARYFAFIRSALRRASTKYPVKWDVLGEARRDKPKGKAGRHRIEYQCAECKQWEEGKNVAVDHIKPAGSLNDYEDLPEFVATLFCEPDNLQVLCNPCHTIKTNYETAERKRKRKKK